MQQFSAFLNFSLVLAIANGQNSYKTVFTKSGPVRGQLEKSIWLETPFYSFKGIPYAAPPVGELRFKAPKPVKPWSKRLDAFEFGNKCAQRLNNEIMQFFATTEDCLNLNVFVPANTNETKKLPVLFVLPGGIFAGGSGDDALYGSDFTIEHGIILVTLNYRVGMLGFMSLGLDEYSGNMGMKDQRMALKWIHENIGAFGGDNKHITIIGFISGGKAAGLHSLDEESSKYFNQQIVISATANNINTLNSNHRCLVEYFYEQHNNSSHPSDEQLIEFLVKADINDILDFNEKAIGGPGRVVTAWNPIIENLNAKDPFLTEDPLIKLRKSKNFHKTSYFTVAQYEQLLFTDGTNYSNPEVINAFLNNFYTNLPIFGYNETLLKNPVYLAGVWSEMRKFYFDNASTDYERFIQRLHLDSDIKYVYFVEKWMKQHVAVSNKDTFYSRFSLSTKLNPHDLLNAGTHSDEYCYVFRCRRFNEFYKQINANKDSDKDAAITFNAMKNMQALFYNFAKYGNPVHNNEPTEQFKPIGRSSQADQFNFLDVRNDGLVAGVAPNANRTKFLDKIIEEVKQLVAQHGETPKETPLQQICNAVKRGQW